MKVLCVTMPDGTIWAVPVNVIADNRARAFVDEFGGDHERSLKEDTLLLFAADDYEIIDWAANNMEWDEVKQRAKMIVDHAPAAINYQDGWCNGHKDVEDITDF